MYALLFRSGLVLRSLVFLQQFLLVLLRQVRNCVLQKKPNILTKLNDIQHTGSFTHEIVTQLKPKNLWSLKVNIEFQRPHTYAVTTSTLTHSTTIWDKLTATITGT